MVSEATACLCQDGFIYSIKESAEYFYQLVAVSNLDKLNLLLPLFRPTTEFKFRFETRKITLFVCDVETPV